MSYPLLLYLHSIDRQATEILDHSEDTVAFISRVRIRIRVWDRIRIRVRVRVRVRVQSLCIIVRSKGNMHYMIHRWGYP